MVGRAFRTNLLAGAALFTGLAIFGSAPANAESVCTLNTSTFNCIDDSPDGTPTGSGTFSAGRMAMPSVYGQLAIFHLGNLDLVLDAGELTSTSDGVVFAFAGGHLSYVSNGITTLSGVEWVSNTILNAPSIQASTGTVYASGRGVAGVHSAATNGDNFTTGGITIVSGEGSRGIVTQATNGNNVTNTGTITATEFNSRGVFARTFAGTSCGSNTLNVTGDVSVDTYAVYMTACGASTVNVLAGNSVTSSVTGGGWGTILHFEAGVATTTIDGTLAAAAPEERALYIFRASSSVTHIGGTGLMRGSFIGNDGIDTFTIDTGGVWNTAGTSYFYAGADQVTNAGTIVTSGNMTLSGLEAFANSGTIDMANGTVGDTMLLEGDYAGSGGASLHIDATDIGADQLIIGGHAAGATSLFVSTSMLIPDPVLVVDTGSTDANAFVLGSTSATPLIDLNLTQSGDDYFLTAVPSETAQQTIEIAEISQRLWQQSASDLLDGSALKRLGKSRDRRTPLGFWARSYGGRNYDARFSNSRTADRTGVQAGLDYFVADNLLVGLTGGYGGRETDLQTKIAASPSMGSNLGAYVQYASPSGFYAGFVAKADRSDVRLTHRAFVGADGDPDSKTIGAKAEAGFRRRAMGIGFDASAGLAYVRSQTGDFTVDGMSFDFGNAKSLRGALGVRGEFGGRLGLFASTKVYHEFDGKNELTVRTGAEKYTMMADGPGTWARFEAGINSQGELGPMLSAWAELGEGKGLGMKAGLRF